MRILFIEIVISLSEAHHLHTDFGRVMRIRERRRHEEAEGVHVRDGFVTELDSIAATVLDLPLGRSLSRST